MEKGQFGILLIHDIIHTNVSLHRIRLTDTEICTHCGRKDTKLHRLTECGMWEVWEWTRTRIERIQRKDPRRIPKEWFLRSCFKLWPRKRYQTTLCFWRELFFMLWINAGLYRYWNAMTVCIGHGERNIRTKKWRNGWENIWRSSKQTWNTGTFYDFYFS